MSTIDARVPVRLGLAVQATAVLIEAGAVAPPGCVVARIASPTASAHVPGCACCTPRGAVAEALRRLFLARARGEVAFFRSVSVLGSPATQAMVREVLRNDPVIAAWFRLAD